MKKLNEIDDGKKVRVIEITGDIDVRQRLSALGIHMGDIILVKRRSAWGSPVLIEVHGSEVALGRVIAFEVQVEEV